MINSLGFPRPAHTPLNHPHDFRLVGRWGTPWNWRRRRGPTSTNDTCSFFCSCPLRHTIRMTSVMGAGGPQDTGAGAGAGPAGAMPPMGGLPPGFGGGAGGPNAQQMMNMDPAMMEQVRCQKTLSEDQAHASYRCQRSNLQLVAVPTREQSQVGWLSWIGLPIPCLAFECRL